MAEKTMPGFDVLIDLSRKFVESQKGVWDHTAWMDFLSGVQKKGFELSDDMKTYLGSVLETMKKVYDAATATKGMERAMSDVSKLTVDFLKYTQGIWTPPGLEAFLKDLQKKGVEFTDETRSYFEEVLEAARQLYTISPVVSKKEAEEPAKEEAKEPAPAKKK